MKKSEIKLLMELRKGKMEAKDLALALNINKGFLSRILKNLIKRNLVEKIKEEGKNYYKISDNPNSVLILRAILLNKKILEGKREHLLPFLIEKSSLKDLYIKTGVSLKQLVEYLKEFQSFGVVLKENKKYYLNPEKEDIVNLARILRISLGKEKFVWKKGNECLKASDEKNENFTLTAFSVFPQFNVKIIPDKFYYYSPKRELSVEEIFVHSLVFSSTMQTLFLSLIFYLKNKEKMDLEKVSFFARKYGVKDLLQKIFDYLDGKEVKDERFLSLEEFKEKAKLYGIKIEKRETEKEKLINLFKELNEKLSKKIEIYLIGGANMVLGGLKISTKDIDIIVEKKHYEILKDALLKLGFSYSLNIFESKDYRLDVFVERVLKGYYLSDRMKKASKALLEMKNLSVMVVPFEYVFLFKSYSGREIDVEDCKILAERGLNWKIILEEVLLQEKELKKFLSISLLDLLNELNSRYRIKSPIIRFLDKHCMKKLIEISLAKGEKTVKDLVFELEKPESSVRKVLNEMIREKTVKKIKRGKILYFKSL
jgi:predicted transcriptional regulator